MTTRELKRLCDLRALTRSDDQPFVDHWPMSDEALSKIPAPVGIELARMKFAHRVTLDGRRWW